MKLYSRRKKPNIGKGLMAGLAAGFIASWGMNQYQKIWVELFQRHKPSPMDQEKALDENVTVKVAEAFSKTFLDRPLKKSEKETAGNAVHYAFGSISAGLYGLIVEYKPSFAKGFGLPFGTFVWLQADELAMPALGLSKSVTQYPLSNHFYSLTSHLIYGFITEVIRRPIRTKL